MKKLSLLWLYARDFLLLSGIISLLSFYILALRGAAALTAVLWLKVIVAVIAILVHRGRKEREIFFYLNNRLSEGELAVGALALDFGSFVVGIIAILKVTV